MDDLQGGFEKQPFGRYLKLLDIPNNEAGLDETHCWYRGLKELNDGWRGKVCKRTEQQ